MHCANRLSDNDLIDHPVTNPPSRRRPADASAPSGSPRRWRHRLRCRPALLALLMSIQCCLPLSAQTPAAEPQTTTLTAHGPGGLWLLRPDGADSITQIGNSDPDLRRIPASSFKPLLALIALQTGALRSADELVPWDGRAYPRQPHWQRAMTLEEAMATSSESYFRTLAERVGSADLQTWLTRVGYGNAQIGSDVRTAWLDGVLRISAREQLEFAERLSRGELPFEEHHLSAVRRAMRDQSADLDWSGKTGTYLPSGDCSDRQHGDSHCGLGWWIGWTNGPEGSASFVLLVELDRFDGREARLQTARTLLQQAGLVTASD